MNSKWLRCRFRRTRPSVYMVCFPWAGGGTVYYTGTWSKKLPKHVEVHGVCLPGRENRFQDPFSTEWQPIVKDLCEDIQKTLDCDKPLIFWGHSMGAIICYEVARYLKIRYGREPIHLLISGASAPQARSKSSSRVSQISNGQLAEKIKNWGGTPQAILDNKEIMDISVKILRADLTLIENYRFIPEDSFVPDLSCPITCFDGTEDLRQQEGWSERSTGHFTRHILEGGHFYFMRNTDNEEKLMGFIKEILPYSG